MGASGPPFFNCLRRLINQSKKKSQRLAARWIGQTRSFDILQWKASDWSRRHPRPRTTPCQCSHSKTIEGPRNAVNAPPLILRRESSSLCRGRRSLLRETIDVEETLLDH